MAVITAADDGTTLFEGDDLQNAEDQEVTPYVIKLALVAGLGGLLFGLDTGVIGGILVVIGSDISPPCSTATPLITPNPSHEHSLFSKHSITNKDKHADKLAEVDGCVRRHLTVGEESLVVSATTIGALVASLLAGWLSDVCGRKRVIIIAAILFTVGALQQTVANNVNTMVAGRVLVGVAVGLSSTVTPVYIAELSPPKFRGRLVALLIVLITAGQVIAYIIGAIFYSVESGWRYMSFSASIPAILQFALSFSLVESPRWYISKNRTEEAKEAFKILYSKLLDSEMDCMVKRMKETLRKVKEQGEQHRERPRSLSNNIKEQFGIRKDGFDRLWKVKANRRALLLACGLQFIQQATGFNTLMYYSPKILALEGFAEPSAAAIIIALSNFACTLVALRCIDSMGRRSLLLKSLFGMAIGQFFIGLTFLYVPQQQQGAGAGMWGILSLVSMVGFCCSFALGLGNVPWIVQSEIFTYEVRSVGNSLATTVNWTSNFWVSLTFLPLTQVISPTGVFWGFCAITILGFYFTFTYLPETKGLSLEDARRLFESDDDDEDGNHEEGAEEDDDRDDDDGGGNSSRRDFDRQHLLDGLT